MLQVAFIERKGLRKILNLDDIIKQCNGLPLGHGQTANCSLVSFDTNQDFPDTVRLLQDMDVLVWCAAFLLEGQGALSLILDVAQMRCNRDSSWHASRRHAHHTRSVHLLPPVSLLHPCVILALEHERLPQRKGWDMSCQLH